MGVQGVGGEGGDSNGTVLGSNVARQKGKTKDNAVGASARETERGKKKVVKGILQGKKDRVIPLSNAAPRLL